MTAIDFSSQYNGKPVDFVVWMCKREDHDHYHYAWFQCLHGQGFVKVIPNTAVYGGEEGIVESGHVPPPTTHGDDENPRAVWQCKRTHCGQKVTWNQECQRKSILDRLRS